MEKVEHPVIGLHRVLWLDFMQDMEVVEALLDGGIDMQDGVQEYLMVKILAGELV